MAANTTTLTYGASTGSSDLFKLTDTTSNTGTGILMHLATTANSTLIPWQADANGVGWQVGIDGSLQHVGPAATGSSALYGLSSGSVTQTVNANAGTWTLTWPTAPAGAGQYFTTNTSGVASWRSADEAMTFGSLSLTATGSAPYTFTPSNNAAITRIEWNLATAAVGCSTYPIMTVMVNGAPSTLLGRIATGVAQAYQDGSAAVTTNQVVTVQTTTAAVGCSTPPSAANLTIHYTQQ
jgi:hypothetical protein